MKKVLSLLMILSLMSLVLAGCGASSSGSETSSTSAPQQTSNTSQAPSEPEHKQVTITIAAAASLENTFVTKLIPMFNEQYSWITVEGTYDSSGKLQTQIEEGLEADLFFSAANKQMNALIESGMIDENTVIPLLENEIVLIAPIDSDTKIDSFDKIDEAASIALGDPESVPAGQYAKEALTNLGVWDSIQSKVSFGTNVTEVLNQIAAGSADVGIVYATDAAQMPDKVKVLAVAPEGSLEKKVIYPVGVLTNAPQREAAELFMEFLQSPEAIAVFVENGFKSNV